MSQQSSNQMFSSLDVDIETDETHNVMQIICRGTLTKAATLEMLESIKHVQQQRKNYHRLYDLSRIEVEVAVSEYETLLSDAQLKFEVENTQHRVAFYAQDPLVLQLLGIYKSLAQRYPFHAVDYFNNRANALRWLVQGDRQN